MKAKHNPSISTTEPIKLVKISRYRPLTGWSKFWQALKLALLVTFWSIVLLLLFGVLVAAFVFSYSSAALKVLFAALPIISLLIFASIFIAAWRQPY